MGAYYTLLSSKPVDNTAVTYTHGLSITPSLLVARAILHQATNTATVPIAILTVGTNILTVAAGVSTTMTCDLEITQIHSIIA